MERQDVSAVLNSIKVNENWEREILRKIINYIEVNMFDFIEYSAELEIENL